MFIPIVFFGRIWEELVLILFLFFCFVSLGLHPQHMEVPRLGVEMELELLACSTAMPDPSFICSLHHSSWQRQILNPLSKARDKTHVLMDTNRVHIAEPQGELSNSVLKDRIHL